jgi:hypothetical protein
MKGALKETTVNLIDSMAAEFTDSLFLIILKDFLDVDTKTLIGTTLLVSRLSPWSLRR